MIPARWTGMLLVLGLLVSCNQADKQLELELRKSFKTFLESVEKRDEAGLNATVFFPGVRDTKGHVQQLLLTYLDEAQTKGVVTFDEQGVVLARFLGLRHLSYGIKKMETSEDGLNAEIRIAVAFAYDNNIVYSLRDVDYQDGTRFLIPGKPWGSVITITLGGDIPIPREQLKYVEIDISFRKTNYEGLWQVRRCVVDESSLQFETSLKNDFTTME